MLVVSVCVCAVMGVPKRCEFPCVCVVVSDGWCILDARCTPRCNSEV